MVISLIVRWSPGMRSLKWPGAKAYTTIRTFLFVLWWKHFPFEKWDLKSCSSQSCRSRKHKLSNWVCGNDAKWGHSCFHISVHGTMYSTCWAQHHIKLIDLECTMHFGGWSLILTALPLSCHFSYATSLLHWANILVGVVGDISNELIVRYQVQISPPLFFKVDP